MIVESKAVPSDLRRWVNNQLEEAYAQMVKVGQINELHGDDEASWARHMLEVVNRVRTRCTEVDQILSVYTYTEGVLPLSTVARSSGMTPNGMRHRASSPAVRAAWDKAMPDRPLNVPE